jgi:hypothetical protein
VGVPPEKGVMLRFSLLTNCAHNGLSLGPSLYFVIHFLSRTDYDSYTSDS